MTLDAKALVLRHHEEIWTRGNLHAIDDLYAPDFLGHHPPILFSSGAAL
jgi:hypothetical protein